jgi:aminoglycoside 3-N-acetyltransferase I
MNIAFRRLGMGDVAIAKHVFHVMAGAFDEAAETLADRYVERLLRDPGFWVVAALAGDEAVGGATAHALPMTRDASSELFVYDIAVRADHRRRGVGRALMKELRTQAVAAGMSDVFLLVEEGDDEALDFYRALGGKGAAVTMITLEG